MRLQPLAKTILYYCNIAVSRCIRLHFETLDYYDLTLVLEGTLTYHANGKKLVLSAGDAILLPPDTLRAREANNSPVRYVSFNFLPNEGASLELPMYMPQCITKEMTVAMMNFPTSHIAPTEISRAKCLQTLNYVLLCLLDGMRTETKNVHVLKMLSYLETRMTKKTSLGEISAHVGLSNEYASALFKREMHKTITDYLTEQRLLMAKGMILGGEMSLAEIAERIGYENYNYFSRSFKAYFGITPIQIKQSKIFAQKN